MPAPIALFTFNRLQHTRATIDALKKNMLATESDLWIFSDGPSSEGNILSVEKVRDYLRTVTGFKTVQIVEREKNYGLGNNIIDGVTQVVSDYGKVIVLEDDLITSPFFLQFMNDGLDIYENHEKVISIHGYILPVEEELPETFFLKGADCLGWGTWLRSWKQFERDGKKLLNQLEAAGTKDEFDFGKAYPYTQMLKDQIEGKNNSWAIRWYASAFLKDLFTLYPFQSLVFHAGGDGTGTNTGFDRILDVDLTVRRITVTETVVVQNHTAYKAFAKVLKKMHKPPLLYRIKRRMRKLLS